MSIRIVFPLAGSGRTFTMILFQGCLAIFRNSTPETSIPTEQPSYLDISD
jgi:hypothetical protein